MLTTKTPWLSKALTLKMTTFITLLLALALALLSFESFAHGVDDSTRNFLENNFNQGKGIQIHSIYLYWRETYGGWL